MTTETKPLKVGDRFHFLVTGFTFPESGRGSAGMVSRRGQELTITDDMIEANRDRLGDSWLDLIHDPHAQLARWGHVVAAPGQFPADALKTLPGELEHDEARRVAARAARALVDPGERAQALRNVEARWGCSSPTSRTLAQYAR